MNVAFGSNCEELMQETLFAFLVPPSRCELLLVRSLSAFWKIIADRQVAIRHRGPRDVAGWSMVGGLARYVASHPGHRATQKHREPKLAHQLSRAGSHPCFPEARIHRIMH